MDSAEVLASQPTKGRRENICDSAQQSIEKTLKSVICAIGQSVPLTHTIDLLLDRLGKDMQPPHGDALIELTDFATVKRYQEGNEIISNDDLVAVIEAARITLKWEEQAISKELKGQ